MKRSVARLVSRSARSAPCSCRSTPRRRAIDAAADKTLSPYFFVEGGDPAIDRLPLKDTQRGRRDRRRDCGRDRPAGVRESRNAAASCPLRLSRVHAGGGLRHDDDRRRRAHRGQDQGARAGRSGIRGRQARGQERIAAGAEPAQRVLDEGRQRAAGRHDRRWSSNTRSCSCRPTACTSSCTRRSSARATRRSAKARRRRKTSSSRRRTRTRARRRAASSTSRAWCPRACRFRSSRHPRISSSSARPAPGRAEMTLADSERFSGNRDFILRYRLAGQEIGSGLLLYQGPDENFFLLMAEPPQAVAARRGAAARVHLRARRVGIDERLSAGHGEEADGRSRERPSPLRHVQHRRVCRRLRDVLAGRRCQRRRRISRARCSSSARRTAAAGRGSWPRCSGRWRSRVSRQASRSIVLVTDGYIEAEADVFDYVRAQLDDDELLRVRHRQQREPASHRGRRAGGTRRTVHRHRTRRGGGGGGAAPALHRHARAHRHRRDVHGFDAYDVEPEQVPDLFASRPIVVFGKWRGSAGGIDRDLGHDRPRRVPRRRLPVTPASADARHARPAASVGANPHRRPVGLRSATPRDERVAEITSLGLTYGLLTRYTSFIAVQEVVRNTADDADDVDQPLPLPEGVSDLAVGVTSGPEPEHRVGVRDRAGAARLACSLLRVRRRRSGVAS